MRCVVIKGASEQKVETNVNEWFNNNPNVKIHFITQAYGGKFLMTTIFYE